MDEIPRLRKAGRWICTDAADPSFFDHEHPPKSEAVFAIKWEYDFVECGRSHCARDRTRGCGVRRRAEGYALAFDAVGDPGQPRSRRTPCHSRRNGRGRTNPDPDRIQYPILDGPSRISCLPRPIRPARRRWRQTRRRQMELTRACRSVHGRKCFARCARESGSHVPARFPCQLCVRGSRLAGRILTPHGSRLRRQHCFTSIRAYSASGPRHRVTGNLRVTVSMLGPDCRWREFARTLVYPDRRTHATCQLLTGTARPDQ